MHQVTDLEQFGAQFAAGVEQAEMVGGEGAVLHQGHGEGIAKGQGHGGRGGRHHAGAAGLGGGGQQDSDVGLPHQGRIGAGCDADQRDAEAAGMGDDVGQFRGFAGVRQDQRHIAFGHHAKVTVACLGRVDELGGGAGGGEGRGDLAGDVARFAHARDDDATFGGQNKADRPGKTIVK